MTSAGDLRHRVAFEKRAVIDDGYGNTVSGDFEEQFVVSASVQAKFGGESVLAARLTGEQPWTVIVRQSRQTRLITTEWRARDVRSGATWNIRSIVDPDDSRAFLEMLVQSGVAA